MLEGKEGKEESKATEVEKPKDSVDNTLSDGSGSDIEVVGKVDSSVSDDDLKAAYRNIDSYDETSVKSDEKAEEKAPEAESNKAEVKEEDSLDSAILEDLKQESKEKPSLVDKEDRPEINKVRELERKLEEKEKKLNELVKAIEDQPGIPQYPPEFFEKVAEKYGVDVEQAKAFIMMNEDAYATSTKPLLRQLQKAIDDIKGEKVIEKAKENIRQDKLYDVLKDEVKSVMESDPDIKDIPDSPAKYRLALAKAKENKLDLIIKATKNRAKKQAMDNVKIIPSGEEGVKKEVKKDNTTNYSKEDLYYAKKLGFTKKDFGEIGKTPKSFTEG